MPAWYGRRKCEHQNQGPHDTAKAAPEAEKQWCRGERYAFSCTVDLLDVRHLLRQ